MDQRPPNTIFNFLYLCCDSAGLASFTVNSPGRLWDDSECLIPCSLIQRLHSFMHSGTTYVASPLLFSILLVRRLKLATLIIFAALIPLYAGSGLSTCLGCGIKGSRICLGNQNSMMLGSWK